MAGHPTSGLLVGRNDERKAIGDAVSELIASGAPRHVVFEGEPGIGKTSLLAELLRVATDEQAQILYGSATALDRARPFGPLLDALRVTNSATADDGRPLDGAVADAIDGLQQVLETPPGARLSPLQNAPEQQAAVVEGLVALTEHWAGAGPVVLAIDDLHEADPATLGAMALLARRIDDLPVLFAATTRLWPRSGELVDLLADWSERGGVQLRIGPLAEPDVAELLEVLAGAPPDKDLTLLAEDADGNPFLLNELMRSLREHDRLVLEDGLARASRTSESDILDRASATIVTRMARLGPEATTLLQTAAVLGRDFTVDDLALVLDVPVASLLATLHGPMEAGLLDDRADRLHFQHELVRDAVAATIPKAVMPALQLDVARRLRAGGAPASRVVGYYLAGAKPGDTDAIDALTEAALRVSGSAPAAAAELLGRALELAPITWPERDRLTADLVDILCWCGRIDDATALAETTLARPLDAEVAAALHETVARGLIILGRSTEALAHLDAARRLPVRSRWASALAGVVRVFALDLEGAANDAAFALTPDATGSVGGGRDPWAEMMGEIVLSWIDNLRGYFDSAVERCTRGVTVANESPGLELHRLIPYLFLGSAQFNGGQETAGAESIREGRAIAEELGTVWAFPFYHYAEAQSHWTAGRLDDLLAECEAGLRCAADHNSWLAAPYARALAACAHLSQGRPDDAAVQLDQGEALLEAGGPQFGLDRLIWVRGLWSEAIGDTEAALATWSTAMEVARGMHAGSVVAIIGPDLLRLRAVSGDEEGARELLAELEQADERRGDEPDDTGRVAVDLKILRSRGLLDGDPALVERARDGHRRLGWWQEAVLDEEALVLAHLRRGDREAADAALRACLQVCNERGLPLVSDRIRRQAAAAGLTTRRGTSRRAVFGWESLTDTERRVAGLIAEGLTNPQIADTLDCSRRTVESHLHRVYRKLDVSNRTELAVLALARPSPST